MTIHCMIFLLWQFKMASCQRGEFGKWRILQSGFLSSCFTMLIDLNNICLPCVFYEGPEEGYFKPIERCKQHIKKQTKKCIKTIILKVGKDGLATILDTPEQSAWCFN